jgi:hypothetical protein
MIRARRGEQQSLSLRTPTRFITLEQQLANGFRTAAAARFSGYESLDASALERL